MARSQYEELLDKAILAGRERDYIKASNLLLRIVSESDELPQAYLYLGRSYHALGNVDLAIQFLRYYVGIKPEVGAGHFFLGRALLARGLAAKAILELRIAAEIDPDNGQAHALLGLSFLRQKQPDLASESLGRAVELEPTNGDFYDAYRSALIVDAIRRYRSGDLDLARQMFVFLLEAGYEGSLPLLYIAALEKEIGNYEEALRWYDRAILYNTEDPLLHLQRARMLHRLGRTAEAVEVFTAFGFSVEQEGVDLDNSEIDRYMATTAYQKNHLRKAILHAKRVIKRDGPDYEMHTLLGEAFRRLESFTKAKNHFQRAHELAPKRIEPLYGTAMVLWQLGMWEEMLHSLARIERLSSGDTIAAYYRALCVCKLEKSPEETIPEIQRAMLSNEPDQYLYAALGNEYLRDNRPDLAEIWFRKSLDNSPANREAHQGLIQTYRLLDDRQKELDSFEIYLGEYQSDLSSRKEYIQLLLASERYAEATEQAQIAMSLGNDDGELKRLLAFCHRKTGGFREAAVMYKNLLKDDPKNEDYLRALCFCLEASKNRKTAVTLLENAVKYLDPSVDLRLIYGVLLFRENKLDLALEQFRIALEISKDDWRAYKNMAMIYRKRGIEDYAQRYLDYAEKSRAGAAKGLVDL